MMDWTSYFGGLTEQQTNEVAYLVVLNLREALDPSKVKKLSAAPDRQSYQLADEIAHGIEQTEGAKLDELSVPTRHRYIDELGRLSQQRTLAAATPDILDQAENELRAFRAM